MLRWLLAFSLVGVGLAELLGRVPLPGLDPYAPGLTLQALATALLYPGFLPFAAWLPVEWWMENEILVHYLGVLANAALFAALGAWLYDRRESATWTRFGVPLGTWVFFAWFCVEGELRMRLLAGL